MKNVAFNFKPPYKLALLSTFLATGMISHDAHAQSSVTLYGLISTGIQYVNNSNGHSLVTLANGGMQVPRWGLRGIEDLGGGNSAVFTLENGFSITTGAALGGLQFGRQAFVGLSNKNLGTVTLGRQYDEMSQQLWWAESANYFAGLGTHIGDSDNIYNTQRFNNDIRYASPNFSGFTFSGSYAFSNSTGFSNNNGYTFGSSYVAGNLKVGAAFAQYNRRSNAIPANLASGAVDSSGWGFSSPFVNSRDTATAGTDSQRIFAVGANYDFGFVNATVSYSNVAFNYSDRTGLHLNNVEGFVYKRLAPDFLVGAAYIYTFGQYSDGADPKYHQGNLAAIYSLSKRTDLFAFGVYQHAAGDAKRAWIYGSSASTTQNQLMFEAGIRHRF
jgi:general bacterial porin, GBP family